MTAWRAGGPGGPASRAALTPLAALAGRARAPGEAGLATAIPAARAAAWPVTARMSRDDLSLLVLLLRVLMDNASLRSGTPTCSASTPGIACRRVAGQAAARATGRGVRATGVTQGQPSCTQGAVVPPHCTSNERTPPENAFARLEAINASRTISEIAARARPARRPWTAGLRLPRPGSPWRATAVPLRSVPLAARAARPKTRS